MVGILTLDVVVSQSLEKDLSELGVLQEMGSQNTLPFCLMELFKLVQILKIKSYDLGPVGVISIMKLQ